MVTFDGYDVELSRGDTLVMKIELDGRDLPEGTDGVFTIKKRITSDEVVLQKRFNASDEELVVVLDADETNIAPGTYFWDVRLQIPMEEGGYEVYTPMEYAAFVVLPVVGVDIGTDGSNMANPDLPVLQLVLAEAREVIDEVAATQEEADKALDTANNMLITAGKTLARSETALSNSDAAVNNANDAAENANDAANMLKGLLVSAESGEEANASVSIVNGVMQMDLVLPRGEPGIPGPQGEPGERGLPGLTGPAGNSPYVGENGNWWYYDDAESMYKDTGVYSGGNAPYIGENGNWFIGTEDSGVAATGPEGRGIETVKLSAAGQLTVKYTDGSSKIFSQSLIGPAGYSPKASITVISDANGVKTHTLTITDKDGTETTTISDGAKGDTGPAGPQGETGEQGPKGDTGETGPQGPKGDAGETGPQGPTGPAGANGVSATHSWNGTTLTVTSASGTSSANLKGDKGDKGDTGSQGPKGDKGDTGATGTAGYTPVRGTDYWTAADIAEIKSYVDSAILNGSW